MGNAIRRREWPGYCGIIIGVKTGTISANCTLQSTHATASEKSLDHHSNKKTAGRSGRR